MKTATEGLCSHCGDRNPSMGPSEIKRAKVMLAHSTITVAEVAQQLGVKPFTLYQDIPGVAALSALRWREADVPAEGRKPL